LERGVAALEQRAERHFEQILIRARQVFDQIEILDQAFSPVSAVLKFRARWKNFLIAVSETIEADTRWYSYYLLIENRIAIGLDNFSDRPALRLKYGKDFVKHLYETIPHLHLDNKRKIELTDEKTFDDFVKMVLEFVE
jgi:hypothetical protein